MHLDPVLDTLYVLSSLWGVPTDSPVCTNAPRLTPHSEVEFTSLPRWPVSAGITAFVDVTVVPMDRERVLPHQTVIIEGETITALGPVAQVPVPAGAVRVDGRGKYLIPGLANMHFHTSGLSEERIREPGGLQDWLLRMLADGVTTLRALQPANTGQKQLWKYMETGDVPIPRIYLPISFRSSVDPDSVAALVTAGKAEGYTHVSPPWIYAMQRADDPARAQTERLVLDSVIAAARRAGLPVAAHSHRLPFATMLALGTTGGSTEHVYEYWDTLGFTMGRTDQEPSEAHVKKIPSLVAATRQAGVWVTPTLQCSEGVYASPTYHKILRRIVKSMQDAGVGLLLSDDDGWSAHDELTALVRAGLTPYQALVTGTRNPAQFLGRLDSSGTVAVGKSADLVLLGDNPLTDVRHAREPVGVMIAGRWLDRATLDHHLLASERGWFTAMARTRGITYTLTEAQRDEFRAHANTVERLIDSLHATVPSGATPAEAEPLRQRLEAEIGAMRAILTTPEQRENFDAAARVWLREQTRQGRPMAVPGITSAPSGVTAFTNVTVIPMDAERMIPGQTVLIKDGAIIAMGAAHQVAVPSGAQRIDGAGKFLIPGLGDMHAHVPSAQTMLFGKKPLGTPEAVAEAERMLFLWLANGVTTVRVLYGWPETLELKRRVASGELLSPRIYAATLSHNRDSFPALKAQGYDLVKIRSAPRDTAAFDSLVAAAHRAGLPVVGHVPPSLALRNDIASIEHLEGFSEELVGVESWGRGKKTWGEMAKHPLDSAMIDSLALDLFVADIWNTPTQMLYEINLMSADSLERWPEMRYLSPKAFEFMRNAWKTSVSTDSLAAARPAIEARRKVIKALSDAGAGLLLGSDAPATYMVPGFAVHRELDVFVKSGLTPYEALETATRNVAEYFGTLDSTGTVSVGKRADLVLLNGNPLQDITSTAHPAGVMIGGRWLGRAELDRRLAELEGRAF